MFVNRLLLSGKKLLVGDKIIISRSRLPPKLFYNQFRSKRGKLKLIELDENEIRDGSKNSLFVDGKSCRLSFFEL